VHSSPSRSTPYPPNNSLEIGIDRLRTQPNGKQRIRKMAPHHGAGARDVREIEDILGYEQFGSNNMRERRWENRTFLLGRKPDISIWR
jgi:hypothetical protein